jgi:ABC-2 type transport system permease protein
MPIHDVTYRHWSGEWTSHPYRWWVITRQGISLLIRKKRFVALMILSAIPFLVRTVILYLSVVVGQLGFLKIDAKFFEDFLTQQLFFAFVIAIYAGAGLIANDLKGNALQIYLSKPITRKDYVIGKLGVVAVFLSIPTLVPGLLLFVLAVAFHSNLDFLQQNYWVIGSIVMYSLAIILTYGLVVLALSALSKSSRFAGIGFAALFFFSQIVYGILHQILRTTSVAWVSLTQNLIQVGDFFFAAPPHYASPTWVSGLIVAGLMAGSAWLIHRRIRAVEVVQ